MSGVRIHSQRILFAAIATVAMVAIMLALGFWQLERKSWKDALVADLGTRLAARPQALPPASQWQQLDAQRDEFIRVQVSGRLRSAESAFVHAAASALRDDVAGLGYWVFTPLELPTGESVVVNRGFVPQARKDEVAAHREPQPITVTGVLRWPEKRTLFSATDSPAQNLWFVRDHHLIAASKGWGDSAPFYIEVEETVPPTEMPRPGRLRANLRNNHFGYALTWFALAACLTLIFALWAARAVQKGSPETDPPSL